MTNKKETLKFIMIWVKLIIPVIFVFTIPVIKVSAADSLIGQENEIVKLTNEIRKQNGVSPLIIDERLNNSALQKAQDMVDKGYFGHLSPDGLRMHYWINNNGYEYTLAGENLAKGFSSVDKLVEAWENSFSHYVNLVEPKFKHIGIGIVEGEYNGKNTVFVVQHFGVEQITSKDITGFADFASPMIQFMPKIESVAGITEPIEQVEVKLTDENSAISNNDLFVLLALISLAGAGYIVDYISSNRLSQKIYFNTRLR